MPLAAAVQNARQRAQTITWADEDNNAINLTGATLYGRKRDKNNVVTSITGALTLVDAPNGVFTWAYSMADIAVPGAYMVQFNAVYSVGGLREKTYLTAWRVHESLDFASASPSASPSPSPSASVSPSPSNSPSASYSPSAGASILAQIILATDPTNLIALWPMIETSGTNATNLAKAANFGTYLSPVVLANTLGPDGVNNAPLFGAAGSRMNPLAGNYAADFNGAKGTILYCAKVLNSGVWSDGTVRQGMHHQVDANNEVAISRSAVNNQLRLNYTAGGVANVLGGVALPATTNGWFTAAITFADLNNGNLANGWYQGAKIGADMTPNGVWAGTPVTGTPGTWVGDKNMIDTNLWQGWLAYICVWKSVLTAAQLLAISAAVTP